MSLGGGSGTVGGVVQATLSRADHGVNTAITRRTSQTLVERSGSGVELRTLDYENPGSNPGCGVKTLGMFFHSTLLEFTKLNT